MLEGGGEGAKSPRLEGVIQRKHEWETTGTKASHRTWDKLYAILHDSQVSFYKDQKHARSVSWLDLTCQWYTFSIDRYSILKWSLHGMIWRIVGNSYQVVKTVFFYKTIVMKLASWQLHRACEEQQEYLFIKLSARPTLNLVWTDKLCLNRKTVKQIEKCLHAPSYLLLRYCRIGTLTFAEDCPRCLASFYVFE